MAAIRASVPVGYRRLSFRQPQIAFSDRIMVRSHLVAGRHFARAMHSSARRKSRSALVNGSFARRPIIAIPANIYD